MQKAFSLLLMLLLFILSGNASASFWFKVIDVSPITLSPNSEANFTVTVKGLGSEGFYVGLSFRNVSEGLSITGPERLKYVFPAGTTDYNATIRAGDIVPGIYSFEVGVAARGPPGYTTVNVTVEAPQEKIIEERVPAPEPIIPNESMASEAEEAQAEPVPGAGIALTMAVLCLAARRRF